MRIKKVTKMMKALKDDLVCLMKIPIFVLHSIFIF